MAASPAYTCPFTVGQRGVEAATGHSGASIDASPLCVPNT